MTASTIAIEFIVTWPNFHFFKCLTYPAQTSVETVIQDLLEQHVELKNALQPQAFAIGIFGQLIDHNYILQTGDRIEIYRPLDQNPIIMRQERVLEDNRRHHRGRKNGKYRGKF